MKQQEKALDAAMLAELHREDERCGMRIDHRNHAPQLEVEP